MHGGKNPEKLSSGYLAHERKEVSITENSGKD